MRPPSSKISDEDRSLRRRKKKKTKSKSSKRRRDPSISSYSSSDSEFDSRSLKKSSRSKRKSGKRKKESKRLEKRRKGRKKRARRDSSVSSFSSELSRGSSTCSDSERSRSPVRRAKSRKRERKSSKLEPSHRYRSPSYSTYSEHCRGRSRSRTCSPVEERFGGIRREPSLIEDVYREEGERKRLKSVLAVRRRSDEHEDKIIEAYDDYPSPRRSGSYEGDTDKGQSVKESDVGVDGSLVGERWSVEKQLMKDEAEDLELILRQKALENFRKFRGVCPMNRESPSNKKNESSKVEFDQVSESAEKMSDSKPRSDLDDKRQV